MALPDWHLHYNCTGNSWKSVCGQPSSHAGLQLQPVMHGMNLTGGVLGKAYFLENLTMATLMSSNATVACRKYVYAGNSNCWTITTTGLGRNEHREMNLRKLMTDMLRMTTLLPSWGFHTWISTLRRKITSMTFEILSNVRNHGNLHERLGYMY